MAQERTRKRLTSSWSGPSYGVTCAPPVRHFIVHTRRAGRVVTRPLNCGVSRMTKLIDTFPMLAKAVAESLRALGRTELAKQVEDAVVATVTFDNSAGAGYIYVEP